MVGPTYKTDSEILKNYLYTYPYQAEAHYPNTGTSKLAANIASTLVLIIISLCGVILLYTWIAGPFYNSSKNTGPGSVSSSSSKTTDRDLGYLTSSSSRWTSVRDWSSADSTRSHFSKISGIQHRVRMPPACAMERFLLVEDRQHEADLGRLAGLQLLDARTEVEIRHLCSIPTEEPQNEESAVDIDTTSDTTTGSSGFSDPASSEDQFLPTPEYGTRSRGDSAGISQTDEAPPTLDNLQNGSSPVSTRKRKGKGKEVRKHNEDHSEGSGQDDPAPKKIRKEEHDPETVPNLACPFLAHAMIKAVKDQKPLNRKDWNRECYSSGFTDLSRLKTHLHKHHYKPHCYRCYEAFDTYNAVTEHSRQDPPCAVVDGEPLMRLTIEKKENLENEKKIKGPKTERQRWEWIYRMIFPQESWTPSPYWIPLGFNKHDIEGPHTRNIEIIQTCAQVLDVVEKELFDKIPQNLVALVRGKFTDVLTRDGNATSLSRRISSSTSEDDDTHIPSCALNDITTSRDSDSSDGMQLEAPPPDRGALWAPPPASSFLPYPEDTFDFDTQDEDIPWSEFLDHDVGNSAE